ncbi:MAG: hypothetical protein Tsb009_09510 [Planctomycetaceae bacterium]
MRAHFQFKIMVDPQKKNLNMNLTLGQTTRRFSGIGCVLLMLALSGCAAMRPLDGIPASQLPDDYRMPYRSVKSMIDLSLLRQTPPREHRVDSGDVLSIYIESILGGQQNTLAPPVNFRQNANGRSSLGYPIHVREDGTISLPKVKPIHVRGLTISQVERAVHKAYTTGKNAPLVAGAERIFVDLQRPRHHRILVIRQEAGNRAATAGTNGPNAVSQSPDKRGVGRVVSLPVYQNDVLHALAETGGLPGLDAENVIYVIRRNPRAPRSRLIRPHSVPPAPAPAIRPPQNPNANRQTELPPKIWNLTKNSRSRNQSQSLIIRSQSPAPYDGELQGGHTPLSETFSSSHRTAGSSQTPIVPPASYSSQRPLDSYAPGEEVPLHYFPNATGYSPYPAGEFSSGQSSGWNNPWPAGGNLNLQNLTDLTANGSNIIRIPLRLVPGEIPSINENDIILYDGDIVLIESRETDVFFTGGLLGGGKFTLPRDQDLDVLQAMAVVQSQRQGGVATRAIGGISAINQDVTVGASELIVLRKLADGRQASIRVDLYKALRDPNERILVQPGDHLILQYTRLESIGAFIERHILDGVILGGSSGLFFSN